MTPDQLLTWLPTPVLGGLLYLFIKREISRTDDRWRKVESAMEGMAKLATQDALKNLGDRFDGRVAELRERLAVTEARIASMEARR